MAFAGGAMTITHPQHGDAVHDMRSNCIYDMAKGSYPNFIMLAFGNMDCKLKGFTPDDFIK
jgi:hypothetical protein